MVTDQRVNGNGSHIGELMVTDHIFEIKLISEVPNFRNKELNILTHFFQGTATPMRIFRKIC